MSQRNIAYAIAAATSVPMLLLLWLVPYLPTHDGPEHLAAIALVRGLAAGLPAFEAHIEANSVIAGQYHFWIVGAIWGFVEPIVAQKLFVSLYFVALPIAVCFLARSVSSRGIVSAVLAGLIAPGWTFFMGFFNFLFTVPLALVCIGLWIRSRGGTRRRPALFLSLLLPLVGLGHPFVLGVCGLLCGGVSILAPYRNRVGDLSRLALVSVAGLAYLAVIAVATWSLESGGWTVLPTRYLPSIEVLEGFVFKAFGGPTRVAGLLAFPLGLALVLNIIALRREPREAHRDDYLDRSARALIWLSLALFGAYAATPLHFLGWGFFQPRFLFLAYLVTAAAASWRLDLRARKLLLGVSVGVAAIVAWPMANTYSTASAEIERFAAGEEAVDEGSLILPLIFSPSAGFEDPYTIPMQLAGAYYTVARNAIHPYHFAVNPMLHPVLYRDGLQTLPDYPTGHIWVEDECLASEDAESCEIRRIELYGQLAFLTRHFDAAVLWRPSAECRQIFAIRGYETLFDEGGTLVVRPNLGAIDIAFDRPASEGEYVVVLYMPESAQPVGRLVLASSDGTTARIAPLPAGPYRMSVFLDRDGNQAVDSNDLQARSVSTPGEYPVVVQGGQVTQVSVRF